MTKTLNLLLLLLLVISSLYVVRVQYASRLLYTSIANEGNLQAELELEFKHLQQERQNLVTPWRIEQNAQTRLQMKHAILGVIEYIPVNSSGFTPALPADVQLLSPQQSDPVQREPR